MKRYRSSEIIFGTRERFLELRKRLLLLEKLTAVSNRKDVKKILYDIVSSDSIGKNGNYNTQQFICKLINNRSLLQDIIDYLKSGYFHSPTIVVGNSELEKDFNGNYKFKDSEFNASVSITDQNTFREIIEKIQDSEFFNEMIFKKICKGSEKYFSYVKLGCSGIDVSGIVKDNRYGNLFYNPELDLLTCDTLYGSKIFPHKITEKEVQKLLDVEVDGSLLTNYQRTLIDNSRSAKKKIIIDNCYDKIAYFGIEEDDNSIHLVKRKRKSLRL